jgi:hypothetical protein
MTANRTARLLRLERRILRSFVGFSPTGLDWPFRLPILPPGPSHLERGQSVDVIWRTRWLTIRLIRSGAVSGARAAAIDEGLRAHDEQSLRDNVRSMLITFRRAVRSRFRRIHKP